MHGTFQHWPFQTPSTVSGATMVAITERNVKDLGIQGDTFSQSNPKACLVPSVMLQVSTWACVHPLLFILMSHSNAFNTGAVKAVRCRGVFRKVCSSNIVCLKDIYYTTF